MRNPVEGPRTPEVVISATTKRNPSEKERYLASFQPSVCLVTIPRTIVDLINLPAAMLSLHLTSHIRELPPRKRKAVMPPWLLLFLRSNLTVSIYEGKPDTARWYRWGIVVLINTHTSWDYLYCLRYFREQNWQCSITVGTWKQKKNTKNYCLFSRQAIRQAISSVLQSRGTHTKCHITTPRKFLNNCRSLFSLLPCKHKADVKYCIYNIHMDIIKSIRKRFRHNNFYLLLIEIWKKFHRYELLIYFPVYKHVNPVFLSHFPSTICGDLSFDIRH